MTVLKRIIYLLLLLCAACNLNSPSIADPTAAPAFAPLPTDAITPTGEGELTTYNNAAYGFMLEYPSHLQIDDKSVIGYMVVGESINITVYAENPEIGNELLMVESAEDVMMGVNKARLLKGRFTPQHGITPFRFQAIVIQNDGRYFTFVGHVVNQDVEEGADYLQTEVPAATVEVLEQITASLRFTN
ncbi:MAG: hypothetical protein LCI00_16710 [Chloroflexi bacterium]|nr:hypothetical protein [Chloroflexota bacterium]MCC6896632.1 hypothetical protein [Anaerolineae bacterium]